MIKRYNPDIKSGLSTSMVEERIKNNLVHQDITVPTKSIKNIIKSHFFTLFNFLNFGLALAVILVGAYKNVLFIGTVILNMLISIFQEIRAKKIVDKLSLISESKVIVIRDGKKKEITKEEIVLDDLTVLHTGLQVVVDSIIMDGNCLVNEAFVTGEDKPVEKKVGDMLLSGSFIVSGNVVAKVEHIKEENYTSVISRDAKYVKKLNSVLMNSLNKVIKCVSIAIVPIGILLFINQLHIANNSFDLAVINTVAGLIGMIPDGLILLTSTVLAVSVIRLGKYNVLVQELYCIETLARVDVLCLDKTGTITEGIMEVKDIIVEEDYTKEEVETLMDSICHSIEDISPTMTAIRAKFETPNGHSLKYKKVNPFSSDKKYSSIEMDDVTYYLGAPEFIMKKSNQKYDKYSKDYRVLLLAKKTSSSMSSIAIILIQDKIREEAKTTLEYFKKQGVTIKIISGDNPLTVSNIAKRVGIESYDKYIDMSTISTKEELKEAYLNNTIFGRVKPNQKKDLILLIKELGHTVAMTGDGVNDVLALKEADCSIAMASGSDAARNVSQLVLMNSNFDAMPKVVLEGRRTINNIGRSASLFLVKTIYTTLLVTALLFTSYHYPFRPIHLSLMNLITIGAPAFVLALEKNDERVKGNFLSTVIANALPVALTVFVSIFFLLFVGERLLLTTIEEATICVILTTIIMLIYQYRLCTPFTKTRAALFSSMCLIFIIELLFFRDFFVLVLPNETMAFLIITFTLFSVLIWDLFNRLFIYFKNNYKKYIRFRED